MVSVGHDLGAFQGCDTGHEGLGKELDDTCLSSNEVAVSTKEDHDASSVGEQQPHRGIVVPD